MASRMQQEIINERIITAVACTPWDQVGVRRIMDVIESKGITPAPRPETKRGYTFNLELLPGEQHHRSKLDADDVRLIRELRDHGITYATIAEKFECGVSTVRDIVKGKTRVYA